MERDSIFYIIALKLKRSRPSLYTLLYGTHFLQQKKGSRATSRGESQKKKRKGKGEVSSSGRESEVSGRKSGGDGGDGGVSCVVVS